MSDELILGITDPNNYLWGETAWRDIRESSVPKKGESKCKSRKSSERGKTRNIGTCSLRNNCGKSQRIRPARSSSACRNLRTKACSGPGGILFASSLQN